MDMQTAITRFLTYLREVKKRDLLTIAHYRDYLERYARSQRSNLISDISLSSLSRFIREMQTARLSPATQNCHLTALRSFLRWLPSTTRPIEPKDITLHPARHRSPNPHLATAAQTLFTRMKEPHTILELRDRAVLELLWTTNIRLKEIPLLTIMDYATSKMMLRIPSQKTYVRLSHHAARSIDAYLKKRTDSSTLLFIRHDRGAQSTSRIKPISTRSLQRLTIQHSRAAGIRQQITVRSLQQARTLTQRIA